MLKVAPSLSHGEAIQAFEKCFLPIFLLAASLLDTRNKT